jgi:hypothetical protein
MSYLSAVDAWKAAVGSLLRWSDCNLLWRWGKSTVQLLVLLLLRLLLLKLPRLELCVIAQVLLLLWLVQLTPRWGIHHAVLGRSTARTIIASGSGHHLLSLFIISLSNALHQPFLINGGTRQFIVGEVGRKTQAFLQVDGKPFMIEASFLLIRVDVV